MAYFSIKSYENKYIGLFLENAFRYALWTSKQWENFYHC